jgi:hypothetical protein
VSLLLRDLSLLRRLLGMVLHLGTMLFNMLSKKKVDTHSKKRLRVLPVTLVTIVHALQLPVLLASQALLDDNR